MAAGRCRILRQLLFESVTFAADWRRRGRGAARTALLSVVKRVMSDAVPRLSEATVDGSRARVRRRHLGGDGVAVWTGSGGGDLPDGCAGGAQVRRASCLGVARHLRAGRLVVSLQLALTLLLLAGAGLMLKSVWRMTAHPPGFHPAQILTMRVDFTGARYREPERRAGVRRVGARAPGRGRRRS